MQEISCKEVITGLKEHQKVIMERLAESAIKLVNMNDELIGTLEGLENIIFEIFYHVDCGKLRRAWIATRRAVTVAQMLGLGCSGQHRFTLLQKDSDLDPVIMWSTVLSMERLLSLLLGLPTSTNGLAIVLNTTLKSSSCGNDLSRFLGYLTGKILERNQGLSEEQALNVTAEIDMELCLATEQMPGGFWQPLTFIGLERDSLKALKESRRAFGHMCYYTLVVQLHLPHMLSPHDSSQRTRSRIACVNASREILTREIDLQMIRPVSASCRMNDFLALIAGVSLVLGYITGYLTDEPAHPFIHQRLGDRSMVSRALDNLDSVLDSQDDVDTVACATLLRDLLKFEEEVAYKHRFRSLAPHFGNHDPNQSRIFIMQATYFGGLQISDVGVMILPVDKMKRIQSSSGNVTIGGIGSIFIDQSQALLLTEELESNLAGTSVAPPTSNLDLRTNYSAMSVPSISQPQITLHDRNEDINNLAFQDVDTALMDTTMDSSMSLLPMNFDGDGWDLSNFF